MDTSQRSVSRKCHPSCKNTTSTLFTGMNEINRRLRFSCLPGEGNERSDVHTEKTEKYCLSNPDMGFENRGSRANRSGLQYRLIWILREEELLIKEQLLETFLL